MSSWMLRVVQFSNRSQLPTRRTSVYQFLLILLEEPSRPLQRSHCCQPRLFRLPPLRFLVPLPLVLPHPQLVIWAFFGVRQWKRNNLCRCTLCVDHSNQAFQWMCNHLTNSSRISSLGIQIGPCMSDQRQYSSHF